jgi:hypothetical protein
MSANLGYDIHIVRTKDWLNASSHPITKEEVDVAISNDPELAWNTSDYMHTVNGSGSANRYDVITWNGVPSFWWHDNQVVCKTPNETQIIKLVRLAQLLGAYCVGDDGERYELQRGFLGKDKLVTLPAE